MNTELERLQARAHMLEIVEREVRKDLDEVHKRILELEIGDLYQGIKPDDLLMVTHKAHQYFSDRLGPQIANKDYPVNGLVRFHSASSDEHATIKNVDGRWFLGTPFVIVLEMRKRYLEVTGGESTHPNSPDQP